MSKLAVPVHADDHTQGSDSALLTLVEYGDFQCPTCGQAYPIVKQVQEHFGDRLRFVFRHYPLEQHPMAEPAAEAAEFAATREKFWQMHDALFENQAELSTDLFTSLAGSLGLNETALERALDRRQFARRIEADVESGDQSGLTGTPTFYINGAQHTGSFGSQALIHALDRAAED